MKNFKEFLNEEMMPYAQTEKGFVGVDNGPVRDNINIHLAAVTARPHATPYHAMEMVRKVLAPFSIFPPQTNFLDGDSGHEVFQIKQFGDKMGMTNNGEVVVKNFSPYYVYFEYSMNDMGSFDIFCEIVTEDELEEIMSDIEDEMEEGETTDGDEADAEDSFDSYKAGNDLKEDYPGVQRRSNKSLDPDLQKDFKDYKSDQQAKHSSNMVKMSWQNSPNQTYKMMGRMKPWQDTDSRAKYDATRDKIVDKQNQREIRRYAPVTVKEETLEEKTTASKKAKKGTKWKLISRNPDSEGSEMELRQGKRKKMTGYYDRNASMFTMSKTKKGKFDPKSKQKDYDDAKDILKTVKEENLEEKAKWRKGKEANPTSVNPRNDVLKPVPGKKMRSGIGTWLADGKKKTPVQGHANTPDQKGKMAGPRKGAVLPEETLDEVSQKTATSAYAFADDPDYDHPKADKILKHIRRKFGAAAEKGAEAHSQATHWGRGSPRQGKDSLSGGLRQYLSKDLTKSGKVKSSTVKGMKANVKSRKIGGPKGLLPEEQLNELRGKGSVDKEELKKHILKKHDAAWEKTIEKRKKNKSSGPADTRDEDKHRNRLGKMYNKLKEEKDLPWDSKGDETKTPEKESTSRIKKITKKLAKQGMSKANK